MNIPNSLAFLSTVAWFWLTPGTAALVAGKTNPLPAIVPKPAMIEVHKGVFILDPHTRIYLEEEDRELRRIGVVLSNFLSNSIGWKGPIHAVPAIRPQRNAIFLSLRGPMPASPEDYELVASPEAIHIRAIQAAGLFYGVQTLRQLLPPEIESAGTSKRQMEVPCIRIQDKPRFSWRGMMLDCSRTFLPMEYLKRNLDRMALYKLNVLHLHLTDDQGWRLEIRKYPKLTTVGAHYAQQYGGGGGYYTQQEMRGLIHYAGERNITIVPEIEMPGHSAEFQAAYPEMACDLPEKRIFTVHPFWADPEFAAPLCAGNDHVFEILDDILCEVIDLFPSGFIHVGGDEVPKDSWKKCPKCQVRMQAEGLKDAEQLQSYFMRRIEKLITAKGRRMIGWDEILEGGLAPRATVMSWRGIEGGVAAARSEHDAVMVPNENCYFDFPYSKTPTERVYAYNPVPEALTGSLAKRILGVQGAMWTHMSDNPKVFDYQMIPRMVALAEVAWSPQPEREWSDFSARLDRHFSRFELLGINFFNPTSVYKKIGSWEASALSTHEPRQFEWDVTSYLTGAGEYQVQVRRDQGQYDAFVHNLSLLEGDDEIARDGYGAEINTYIDTKISWLSLSKLKSGTRYRIRLTLQGTTTGSEGGSIWILEPPGGMVLGK